MLMIIYGGLIGISGIIPGVSIGTTAFMLGIYGRLLSVVGSLGPSLIGKISQLAIKAFFSKEARTKLFSLLREKDLLFFMQLVLGMFIFVQLFSTTFERLVNFQREETYSFFLGFIIFSMWYPYRKIGKVDTKVIILFILGIALVVGFYLLGDPVAKFQAKSLAYKSGEEMSLMNSWIERSKLLVISVIAIGAGILPGISGGFILLLSGYYFYLLRSINELRDWSQGPPYEALWFFGIFFLGMFLGAALMSRGIKYLFEYYEKSVLSFLTGLIAGSIWVIWPFKEKVSVEGWVKEGGELVFKEVEIYSHKNLFFGDFISNGEIFWSILTLACSSCLMIWFISKGKSEL